MGRHASLASPAFLPSSGGLASSTFTDDYKRTSLALYCVVPLLWMKGVVSSIFSGSKERHESINPLGNQNARYKFYRTEIFLCFFVALMCNNFMVTPSLICFVYIDIQQHASLISI